MAQPVFSPAIRMQGVFGTTNVFYLLSSALSNAPGVKPCMNQMNYAQSAIGTNDGGENMNNQWERKWKALDVMERIAKRYWFSHLIDAIMRQRRELVLEKQKEPEKRREKRKKGFLERLVFWRGCDRV